MLDGVGTNVSHSDFVLSGFSSLGEWRPLLFIPFFLIFATAVAANATLLCVIASHKALHSPMCVLIGVMACVDLSGVVVFVPRALLSLALGWDRISLDACLLQMFCMHFVGAFQSTLLLWMALDRYFAICRPLLYHQRMAAPHFLRFVIGPFARNLLLIAAIVCLARPLPYCRANQMEHVFCEHMALVNLACQDTSVNNLLGLLAAFCIPTADYVLIAASYALIFASVFRSGTSRAKALGTCITHIVVVTLTLIFALVAFLSYRTKSRLLSSHALLSSMYVLFPSVANPLIYGLRTKEIRQQLVKILKRSKISPSGKRCKCKCT
uniref:G-protein coupled receptors family 1 profile domain-containing protein n=1 Tax=Denticeps clupeoides TaxID=299321 RepID=A0AAY4B2X0_9TELE